MTGTTTRPRPAPADALAAAARLRLAVGRLHRQVRARHPGGLTASQLSALVSIETHEPVKLSTLAAVEGVAAPTLTRVVGALAEEGLVERRACPEDGRSTLVSLSAAGRDRLDTVRRERTAWLYQRIADLSPAEQRRLIAAIPALERLLEE